MKTQAAKYERLLVRVPEAYWLTSDYGVTRPGILVLTAEGRKVDAIAVTGNDPERDAVELAVTLELALDAEPEEGAQAGGTTLTQHYSPVGAEEGAAAPIPAAVAAALRKLPGVEHVEARPGDLRVTGARLWLRPKTIVAAAKLLGVELECRSHTECILELEALPGTPSTMAHCKRMEKSEAVVLAAPNLAGKSIRFLLRTDVQVDLGRLIEAAGYRLKPERK